MHQYDGIRGHHSLQGESKDSSRDNGVVYPADKRFSETLLGNRGVACLDGCLTMAKEKEGFTALAQSLESTPRWFYSQRERGALTVSSGRRSSFPLESNPAGQRNRSQDAAIL